MSKSIAIVKEAHIRGSSVDSKFQVKDVWRTFMFQMFEMQEQQYTALKMGVDD